jgi:PHD/YefM family antitoxin component YafN of YafNO toxin-antitoxin module
MDSSEACDFFNSRRRRDEKKRHHVEAAVEGLIRRYGLLPEKAHALNEGIYGLYRNLVAQKVLDDQDRQYRKMKRRAERELAVRTVTASGTEFSAYLADAREFSAHMIRLETLERRNLGRNASIEQASTATWDDLSPRERREARLYLAGNVLPGEKTRQPAREVEFLTSVAGLIEQATRAPISFSSAVPDPRLQSSGRHHGVEFDVMMATAEMADYRLSNEAMARRIQRIKRQRSASFSLRDS